MKCPSHIKKMHVESIMDKYRGLLLSGKIKLNNAIQELKIIFAIYPKSEQKFLKFDWNSVNYQLLDNEGKISQGVQLIYELNPNKSYSLDRYDFLFTVGPLIVSQKVKEILKPEQEAGFVQFFPVNIKNQKVLDGFYVVHITNHENTTDLNNSIYEKDEWDDEEEY